jgi:hypothetical protein
MLYLLKTIIKYAVPSDEFEKICVDVARAQNSSQNWMWKIWGHNPEKKLVEIIYLLDNKEDLRKGIDFIKSMGSMYSFLVEYVDYEEFQVMEVPSMLTNAPLASVT